jgi:hypothetical protein
MYIENITTGCFVSGRSVPTDVLSARTFCPHGRSVPMDVLSLRTFCPSGCFVPPDVLSMDVLAFCLQTFCLMGVGRLFVGGRGVSGGKTLPYDSNSLEFCEIPYSNFRKIVWQFRRKRGREKFRRNSEKDSVPFFTWIFSTSLSSTFGDSWA